MTTDAAAIAAWILAGLVVLTVIAMMVQEWLHKRKTSRLEVRLEEARKEVDRLRQLTQRRDSTANELFRDIYSRGQLDLPWSESRTIMRSSSLLANPEVEAKKALLRYLDRKRGPLLIDEAARTLGWSLAETQRLLIEMATDGILRAAREDENVRVKKDPKLPTRYDILAGEDEVV
jgi:hypothetical protein